MFDRLDSFDRVPQNLPRRKSLRVIITYNFVNWGIVTPFACGVSFIVTASGLRDLFGVMATKISKFPIPGAHLADNFEGIHRIDLAVLCAVGLYFVTTAIYAGIFIELLGDGPIAKKCRNSAVVLYLLLFISAVFLILDAIVFWAGMSVKASGIWAAAPAYAVPIATIVYCCGTALIGWFHADYKTSSN